MWGVVEVDGNAHAEDGLEDGEEERGREIYGRLESEWEVDGLQKVIEFVSEGVWI